MPLCYYFGINLRRYVIMRADGRNWDELRKVTIEKGVMKYAEDAPIYLLQYVRKTPSELSTAARCSRSSSPLTVVVS